MQMPPVNALVVRQTAATLKDSCYAQLQWAINRLGVEKFWKCTVNPLQMTYIPTGQKILFRGIDESLRGRLPEGYYIQWLLTFNPYSSSSWLKARFFDKAGENVLAIGAWKAANISACGARVCTWSSRLKFRATG